MSKEEKKLLIELICEEQTNMIIDDSTKYESERYLNLERLKIKICSGYEDFVPAKMKG